MIGIHSDPPLDSIKDRSNGILQVVFHLGQHLPKFGFEYVSDPRAAHIYVHHAGSSNGMPITVEHCHGLVPTAMQKMSETSDGINAAVIDNIMRAKAVTTPSQWVADILRRDMRLEPFVVPWGVNSSEWKAGRNHGYVLWAKGRADLVCDPKHVNELAARAPDISFVTTFGDQTQNVKVIGMQPFFAMKELLQNAGVYLATTRETFGIQTLEAMACGVPVLGFRWAGITDIVEHGVTGYLAEPGDYDDLLRGLRQCIKNRTRYGEAAIEAIQRFTWQETARQMAEVYRYAMQSHDGPEISVMIPCYNYAQFVGDAIESALQQNVACQFEVIVVNDGSTDQSASVIERYRNRPNVKIINKQNGGVSSARMAGFEASSGKFVCFLDADDKMEQRFLQVCWEVMRKDDRLGVAYTALQLLFKDGIRNTNWPPMKVDYAQLLRGFNQVPTCCLIRRAAFERSGGYRDRFEPSEDGELWARIAEIGYTIECVTKTPLFTYRLGHASLSRGVPIPDYVGWHLPARIGTPPCAMPKAGGNYLVRDYDRPVFSLVVAHDGADKKLYETIDSILAQSYMFWECHLVYKSGTLPDVGCYPFVRLMPTEKRTLSAMYKNGIDAGTAPLIILIESGVTLHSRFLEGILRDWQTGTCSHGLIPRAWYKTMTEKEKDRICAGADVAEILQTENQGGDKNRQ